MTRAPARRSGLTVSTGRSYAPQTSSQYKVYRPERPSWYNSSAGDGLRNLGNTCYLNAVIQAVCSLREFVGKLRTLPEAVPPCRAGNLYQSALAILGQVADAGVAAGKGPVNPSDLRRQIAAKNPMFAETTQQDAHEFFLEFVNQLHDELLAGREQWLSTSEGAAASLGKDDAAGEDLTVPTTQVFFDAEIQKRLKCLDCGHEKNLAPERFRDLSLDFTNVPSGRLEDLIRQYFEEDALEVKCDRSTECQDNGLMTKTLSVTPKVLVLHLLRFRPNMERRQYEKIQDEVKLPQELDLRKCLEKDRLPARPLAGIGAAGEGSTKYGLRAVIEHIGSSPRSGHYICYARSADTRWRKYNDERVVELPGGLPAEVNKTAYILFYVLLE